MSTGIPCIPVTTGLGYVPPKSPPAGPVGVLETLVGTYKLPFQTNACPVFGAVVDIGKPCNSVAFTPVNVLAAGGAAFDPG